MTAVVLQLSVAELLLYYFVQVLGLFCCNTSIRIDYEGAYIYHLGLYPDMGISEFVPNIEFAPFHSQKIK